MDKLGQGAFTADKQLNKLKKCRDKDRGIFVYWLNYKPIRAVNVPSLTLWPAAENTAEDISNAAAAASVATIACVLPVALVVAANEAFTK